MPITITESNITSMASQSSSAVQRSDSLSIVFGGIPAEPVLNAIDGILFDFNDGLRVKLPKGAKPYRIRFVDLDTKSMIYEVISPDDGDCIVTSHKKYFIKFRIVISNPVTDELLFMHDYDAADKEVMIRFPVHTLGDTIAWFSYVERFQKKHNCKVICVVSPWFAEIVKKQYPQIAFIAKADVDKYQPYANYNIGLWEIGNVTHQPIDHRYVGLHKFAGHILGVNTDDEPPRFDLSAKRQIKEKYVCIGVQSTGLAKMWNNPIGWKMVIDYLKGQGYRVLCIDKDSFTGRPGSCTHLPPNAEDFTGDKPLQERIDLLKDADFFIGLSSGLSWLAWGCRIPVVIISGFTAPWNEFHTSYRVINYNACNSCWNDFRTFELGDYWNCPRLAGTDRRFECSAMITHEYVIEKIKQLLDTYGNGEAK